MKTKIDIDRALKTIIKIILFNGTILGVNSFIGIVIVIISNHKIFYIHFLSIINFLCVLIYFSLIKFRNKIPKRYQNG